MQESSPQCTSAIVAPRRGLHPSCWWFRLETGEEPPPQVPLDLLARPVGALAREGAGARVEARVHQPAERLLVQLLGRQDVRPADRPGLRGDLRPAGDRSIAAAGTPMRRAKT